MCKACNKPENSDNCNNPAGPTPLDFWIVTLLFIANLALIGLIAFALINWS